MNVHMNKYSPKITIVTFTLSRLTHVFCSHAVFSPEYLSLSRSYFSTYIFLSSSGRAFQREASCLVSCFLSGMRPVWWRWWVVAASRCSWQNWRKALVGRLGAGVSRSTLSLFTCGCLLLLSDEPELLGRPSAGKLEVCGRAKDFSSSSMAMVSGRDL